MNKIVKERTSKLAKNTMGRNGGEQDELGRLALTLNGCVAYRGPRTKPVCTNMTTEECHAVDRRLKEKDPNFYAQPLNNPCEN